MDFLDSRKAAAPRVGPNHPDYERWLAYFTHKGIAAMEPVAQKQGQRKRQPAPRARRADEQKRGS